MIILSISILKKVARCYCANPRRTPVIVEDNVPISGKTSAALLNANTDNITITIREATRDVGNASSVVVCKGGGSHSI